MVETEGISSVRPCVSKLMVLPVDVYCVTRLVEATPVVMGVDQSDKSPHEEVTKAGLSCEGEGQDRIPARNSNSNSLGYL